MTETHPQNGSPAMPGQHLHGRIPRVVTKYTGREGSALRGCIPRIQVILAPVSLFVQKAPRGPTEANRRKRNPNHEPNASGAPRNTRIGLHRVPDDRMDPSRDDLTFYDEHGSSGDVVLFEEVMRIPSAPRASPSTERCAGTTGDPSKRWSTVIQSAVKPWP